MDGEGKGIRTYIYFIRTVNIYADKKKHNNDNQLRRSENWIFRMAQLICRTVWLFNRDLGSG